MTGGGAGTSGDRAESGIPGARLRTAPALTDDVIGEVCHELRIPATAFPRDAVPAPLHLFPGTTQALEQLSAIAPVVTLSNVTCVDADPDRLRDMLIPWVVDHFPSCRIGYAKPDRRAFEAVAAHRGLHPHQIVHIGDHWECDVLGAIRAGAQAIWISGGRARPDATSPDAAAVHDLGAAADHIRDTCTRGTP